MGHRTEGETSRNRRARIRAVVLAALVALAAAPAGDFEPDPDGILLRRAPSFAEPVAAPEAVIDPEGGRSDSPRLLAEP